MTGKPVGGIVPTLKRVTLSTEPLGGVWLADNASTFVGVAWRMTAVVALSSGYPGRGAAGEPSSLRLSPRASTTTPSTPTKERHPLTLFPNVMTFYLHPSWERSAFPTTHPTEKSTTHRPLPRGG